MDNNAKNQQRLSLATLKKVSRRSGETSTRVYTHLRQGIMEGSIPPGTPLSHKAIASALRTSNGPVITALQQLAHEGLVDNKPGRGAVVREWSLAEMAQQMTVRRALETEAARLAAQHAGPADLKQLYRLVEQMAEAVNQTDHDAAHAIDVELHVAIAKLTNCPLLIEALERCHLLDLIRRRLDTNARFGDFQNLAANHRLLVDAIATHDPDKAAQAMHTHLTPSGERI